MSVIRVVAICWMAIGIAVPSQVEAVASAPAQDHVIVSLVLDDLVTYGGKDSPLDEIFSPDPLTLDPTPLRIVTTVKNLLEQYGPDNWLGLAVGERRGLREAAQDLVRRMKAPAAQFPSGSSRVPLYSGDDPSKLSLFQFREAPIRASVPGYSGDRRIAIVRLSIPWSIHGCIDTYVLASEDDAWQVRVRDFACFL